MKLNRGSRRTAGDGLIFVIIFLALIGVGVWWLYSHKKEMDKEGRAFGREMIEAVAVKQDMNFFRDHLSPQAKLDYPPSRQQEIMMLFRDLGKPAEPIQIEEQMTWEKQFFKPNGFFTANLQYPARGGVIRIAISHPVSKWQLDNIEYQIERER
jgi:hypothetical protein